MDLRMKYNNPIIKGFHPDPSICRVEEDYYLVTSSFEYFPGLPVYHSRDLVNWKQIGNCVQRGEEFPMDDAPDSGGIWAPTIRFYRGKFYVTATLAQKGSFIISAANPAGKWSSPVWIPVGGIDPSLYFEDGRAYYCTNQSLHEGKEEITLSEIDPETGAVAAAQKSIWGGMGGGYLEAPHIYHIDGWYYLIAAEGGTNFNHMATIARSRGLWGPYEGMKGNPLLTNVHDTTKQIQCSGHADLVEDHRGNWWLVHLGIRLARRTMSHLGRETFLTPVVWRDGWPTVENDRKAVLECDGPLWKEQNTDYFWKADFSQETWEPEWIFLRKPLRENYFRGDGCLQMRPSPVTFCDGKSPSFAAIRQPDFQCVIRLKFSFTAEEGDEAGIALYHGQQFHYRFCMRREGPDTLLVLVKTAEDFEQQVSVCSLDTGELADTGERELELIIRADSQNYRFYYCVDGGEEHFAASASTRFLSCEVVGRSFTGTVVGPYAVAAAPDHVMTVKAFRIECTGHA